MKHWILDASARFNGMMDKVNGRVYGVEICRTVVRQGVGNMANFIIVFYSFLSYLLLFILIVILGVIACFIGINLRKKKDAKDAAVQESTGNGQS